MVTQAVHNRRELCKDNPGGWSLQGGVVTLGSVDMSSEQLSKVTSPIGGQQPGCTKRNRFANSFGFPKGQRTVNGVDGIRPLRFSKVVSKATNEVASLGASFIGTESLFHVRASDRVAAQVLDDFP